eukprot:4257335-Amphidinium_carterae.2
MNRLSLQVQVFTLPKSPNINTAIGKLSARVRESHKQNWEAIHQASIDCENLLQRTSAGICTR